MSPTATPSIPRVALIGVSGYGRIYLDLALPAHRAGRLRLTCVVIVNPDQEAENESLLRGLGCTIYRDVDSLFRAEAGRVELCLIPTGIQWHARMTIAALHAGANVLVEKPLAGSAADAAAVIAAERESGRWIAVGFQDIYTAEVRWLKESLLAGRIGRIDTVSVLGLWPRSASYFSRNQWAGRLHADGAAAFDSPLNNAFAHFINLALFLAGPTVDSSADVAIESAELWRAHAIESFDTAVVRGRTVRGALCWFGVSHASRLAIEPAVVIEGTLGRASWHLEQFCEITPNQGTAERRPVPNYDVTRDTMFETVLERLRGPVPLCTTAIAAAHTRLIDRIHRHSEIQTIPAADITQRPPDEPPGAGPCVVGLDERMLAARDARSTLAAQAPKFARP